MVRSYDTTLQVYDRYPNHHLVEKNSEQRLGLGTRPLRLLSCSALLSLRNRSADGRSQPGKSVFENIIGGSALDKLNRQIFTHSARNENERHAGCLSQGDFKCRQTIEGGQGVIR